MHKLTTVQAWLSGGPADGAVRVVPSAPDGRPPALLLIGGGGQVFVGSGDEPTPPPEYSVYEPEPEPVESLWPYRYVWRR